MSRRRSGGGYSPTSKLTQLITAGILCFIGIMFVLGIGPDLETAIGATTITNTFVLAVLGIAEWAIPVGMIVGSIMWAIKLVRG